MYVIALTDYQGEVVKVFCSFRVIPGHSRYPISAVFVSFRPKRSCDVEPVPMVFWERQQAEDTLKYVQKFEPSAVIKELKFV